MPARRRPADRGGHRGQALAGASTRVILGTRALQDPGLVSRQMAGSLPEQIVLGIDARDGKVATRAG